MNKKCSNCNGDTKIYLKSNNKIDLEKIDFSCTENRMLSKDSIPLKPNLFICKECGIIFSEFYNIKFEEKYSDVVDSLYINQIEYKKLYFKR